MQVLILAHLHSIDSVKQYRYYEVCFLIGSIAWLNMVYQYAHKTPQYTLNYFLQPRKLLNFADTDTIGHVNIGIIFLFI